MDGNPARTYTLGYGKSKITDRSRLEKIEVSTADGTAEPIKLHWTGRQKDGKFVLRYPVLFGSNDPFYRKFMTAQYSDMIPGDFNGDGKTDFILRAKYVTGHSAPYFTVFFADENNITGFREVTPTSSTDFYGVLMVGTGANLITGDFNGDGKTDLLRQERGPWNNDRDTFQIYYSRGNGYFDMVQPNNNAYQHDLRFDDGALIIPGDFNGDGKTGFIRQEQGNWAATDTTQTFQLYLSHLDDSHYSNNNPFSIRTPSGNVYQNELRLNPNWGGRIIPGDFNGDGKTDFIKQEYGSWDDSIDNKNFVVYLATGGPNFKIVRPTGNSFRRDLRADPGANIIPGDFNGDGMTDFIRQYKNGNDDHRGGTLMVYFSKGDGNFSLANPVLSHMGADGGVNIIPGDFNGDGRTDFIRQEKNGWDNDSNPDTFSIYYSTGFGTFERKKTDNDWYHHWLKFDGSSNRGGSEITVGDFNGDGISDFISRTKGDYVVPMGSVSPPTQSNFVIHYNNASIKWFQKPNLSQKENIVDRVYFIEEGKELRHEITYEPMSVAKTNSVYRDEYSGLASDQRRFRSSMLLVKKYETFDASNKDGTLIEKNYQYAGAVMSKQGAGFLGFQKVYIDIPSTDIKKELFLYNDRRRAHTVKQIQTRNRTTNGILQKDYFVYDLLPGQHSKSRAVALTKQRSEQFISGKLHTESRFIYDAHSQLVFSTSYNYNYQNPVFVCNKFENFNMVETSTGTNCSYANGSCSCASAGLTKRVKLEYDSHHNVTLKKNFDNVNNSWLNESYVYSYSGPVKGRRIRETNTLGVVIEYQYDDFGFPKKSIVDPGGKALTQEFTYEPYTGQITQRIDENGGIWRTNYDSFGRETAKLIPDGNSVYELSTTRYYKNGNASYKETRIKPFAQNASVITNNEKYDYLGRLVRVSKTGADGLTIFKRTDWNNLNQKSRESLPFHNGETPRWNHFWYSKFGKVMTVQNHEGTVSKTIYRKGVNTHCSANQLKVETTIAEERKEVLCKDGLDNVIKKVFVKNGGRVVQNFTYNTDKKLTSSRIEGHSGSSTIYDTLGRIWKTTHPNRGVIVNQYSPSTGRMVSTSHAETVGRTTYEYDGMARKTKAIYPDGSETRYEYDGPAADNAMGRMFKVTYLDSNKKPASSREFAYTKQGKRWSERIEVGESVYGLLNQFFPGGHLKSTTYPDGKVLAYNYNASAQLHKLILDQGKVSETVYAEFTNYNEFEQPAFVHFANGTRTAYSYNANARLAGIKTTGISNEVYMDYGYKWNKFSEINEINDKIDDSLSQTFGYDKLGQIKQAVGAYGTINYDYDTQGNLIEKEGVRYNYSHNAPTTSSDGMTLEYNAYGARTRKQKGATEWIYEYDGRQKMTRVTRNNVVVGKFEYDGFGKRIKKIDKDGNEVLYISPFYEVTRVKDGPELHTKYIPGPSGRIAAITLERDSSSAAFVETQTAMQASLVGGGVLSGLSSTAKNTLSMLTSRVLSLRETTLNLILVLIVALLTFTVFLSALFRAAEEDSVSGKLRMRFANLLLSYGIISDERARGLIAMQSTGFMRSHKIFRAPVPLLVVAYLSVFSFACSNPSSGPELNYGSVVILGNGLVHAPVNNANLVGDAGNGYAILGTYFFHTNHIGSTSVASNALGEKVSVAYYKPFGDLYAPKTSGPDVYRAKFTGQEWDGDIGLHDFKARYYDSSIGRFIQADNVVFGAETSTAAYLNRYAYGVNNPIIYTDPSGNVAFLVGLGIAILVSTVLSVGAYLIVSAVSGEKVTALGVLKAAAIGALTGMVGFGVGTIVANGVKAAYIMKTGMEATKAVIAAGNVAGGVLGGFTSGFVGSVVSQSWNGGFNEVDWGQAGAEGGIGAGIGLITGGIYGLANIKKAFPESSMTRAVGDWMRNTKMKWFGDQASRNIHFGKPGRISQGAALMERAANSFGNSRVYDFFSYPWKFYTVNVMVIQQFDDHAVDALLVPLGKQFFASPFELIKKSIWAHW